MTQPDDTYREETEKLASVIQSIREQVDASRSRMPVHADYARTADAIQRVLQNSADTIESASQQPYFGRVDFLVQEPREREPRAIYIGTALIPDANVVSWVAPVARLWYTNDSRYTAPRGEIRVRVDLKRYLRIRGQQLIEINDIYRRALPEGSTGPNPALTAALSNTADGHLSVIIETIEPDQYENIANVTDQVLVVQGAAGSGKSQIGFHRIAFLLSPFNDLPERERPTPDTTIFIGPSSSFLEYAADILPNLGVRENVRQTTLRQWLTNCHSQRLTFSARIWNNLLEKGDMTDYDETAESFKGSMGMADALGRYVRQLTQDIRRSVRTISALTLLSAGRRITVSESEIRTVLNRILPGDAGTAPLNVRRQEFVNAIINIVLTKAELIGRTRGQEEQRLRHRISTNYVDPWLASKWPEIDFQQEYINLLSNPERLSELSREVISIEEAEELHLYRNARDGRYEFEDSDIGALTYLDHLLNNTINRRNRHIVVDEAQDVSPIEFMLLRLSSVNNWFTILGDTAQRLAPYRGIRRWRDLERPLGRFNTKVQHARTSYRSNQHITRFNNRILRQFDTYIDAPIPFGREGHRVEFHRHGGSQDVYRYVVSELDRIRSLDDMADAQIAILVRDRYNLRQFQNYCLDNEIQEVTLFGQQSLTSKTVLARIPDAKGLEYDAVIVMGVNNSFASTTFNQKLLYMAATRARHYLAIHWAGQQSPILRAVSDRGIVQFDHR